MSRKVCKSCGLASYCSRECQVKHWPKHKEECKVYKIPLELHEKAKKWAQSGISDEFEQFIDNALMKTPTASKVRLMKFSMKKKENNVVFYSAYDENLFIKIAYCPPEKDSTYKIIPVDKIRAYASKNHSVTERKYVL